MSELTNISPEGLEVANAYIQFQDMRTVADELEIPLHEVSRQLMLPHVKRYIDSVYLDMGYRNKSRLSSVLDRMIDSKLAEAEESEIYTSKDLLELLQFAHKMRIDMAKLEKEEKTIDSQTNIQVNQYGEGSYGKLMEKLLKQ